MLKKYDKYDTILMMPLNPADPAYLRFEKMVLPIAVERGMGIQGMKTTANAGLLGEIHVKDCLTYVLSLPIHCLALGCTTIGQIVRAPLRCRHLDDGLHGPGNRIGNALLGCIAALQRGDAQFAIAGPRSRVHQHRNGAGSTANLIAA
jgi:hypothetical protein